MFKYVNKFFQIVFDLILIALLFLVIFSVFNIISIKKYNKNNLGFAIFEVVSGSMEPTINVKDFIVVKSSDKIEVNDIVTYKEENNFITHRVTKIEGDVLYTKGDANNSEDNKISRDDLIGKVIFTIPKVGIIKDLLLNPKVFISLVIFLITFSICLSYIPNKKNDDKKLNKENGLKSNDFK